MNIRIGIFLLSPLIVCAGCLTDKSVARINCYGEEFIPKEAVGARRLLGSEKIQARAIDGAMWFTTTCPVPLQDYSVPDACAPDKKEDKIDLANSHMTVTQDGKAFRLKVSSTPAIDVPMDRVHVPPPDFATSTDVLEGFDKAGRVFFVYFDDSLPDGTPAYTSPLRKTYYLQIYYPTSFPIPFPPPIPPQNIVYWKCGPHMPDQSAEDGRGGNDGGKRADGTRQGGVGGGTEPGHH